ncbi:metallophosphoesterase [Helicobacter labetoulli]|uniref:metallophosphoesterase n=1 Tax=Helicobacter labetoulli TaxID=2315333 RepID=UPI000EF7492A|nr:metallophosphoesterase [Helicobacter labetoulli]
MILVFVGVVFVVLNAMKVYVYMRFFRHSVLLPKWAGIGILVALALGEIALLVLKDVRFSHWQYLMISSCLVLTLTLFMACVAVDMIRLGVNLYGKIQSVDSKKTSPVSLEQNDINTNRRTFLSKCKDYGVAGLFLLFSFTGFYAALALPPIREVRVKIPHLKTKKSIAMISDVHIGKNLGRAFLEGIVEKINALEADIVVIVGDLADDKIEYIKDDLEPLKWLKSKDGVYYVAGNHEYYHGLDSIVEHLHTLNLNILHNANIELEELNIAGVSDLAGVRFKHLEPDLESAKKGLNPNKPSILLSHQPKFVYENDVSDFDLVLCGHTHAGQVFPLSLLVWLDQHYVYGLYDITHKDIESKKVIKDSMRFKPRQTQLYVSSGVGFWGPAIRFLAPSEIVLFRLE